jgi:DNA polymerase-3 subunit epsilon
MKHGERDDSRFDTRPAPGTKTNCTTMNFVAIDFETANYAQDSACAVGLVKVVDGEIVDSVAHLIRPPTPEFVFTYIHGLTWKHVAKAADFGALWPKLACWFEGVDFLAAHNASFDRGVLNACCATHGIEAPLPAFRCTVTMARRAWNLRPTKLPDVCRHLGIALDHHDALSDALACAKIVVAAELAALDEAAATRAKPRGRKLGSRQG